jgi:hypothetical protein
MGISIRVTGEENDNITLTWSSTSGVINDLTPYPMETMTLETTVSFDAPLEETISRISVTAIDSAGNSSSDSISVLVFVGDIATGVVEETVYIDGQNGCNVPAEDASVALSSGDRVEYLNYLGSYYGYTTTNETGHFIFEDVPLYLVFQ